MLFIYYKFASCIQLRDDILELKSDQPLLHKFLSDAHCAA